MIVNKTYNEESNTYEYSLAITTKVTVPAEGPYIPEDYILEELKDDLRQTINEGFAYRIDSELMDSQEKHTF